MMMMIPKKLAQVMSSNQEPGVRPDKKHSLHNPRAGTALKKHEGPVPTCLTWFLTVLLTTALLGLTVCMLYDRYKHKAETFHLKTNQIRTQHKQNADPIMVRQTWNLTDGVECERYCPQDTQQSCVWKEPSEGEYWVQHEWTLVRRGVPKTYSHPCVHWPGMSTCTQEPNCVGPSVEPGRKNEGLQCVLALVLLLRSNRSLPEGDSYVVYRSTGTKAFLRDVKGDVRGMGVPKAEQCKVPTRMSVGVRCEPSICFEVVERNRSRRVVVQRWQAVEMMELVQGGAEVVADVVYPEGKGLVVTQYASSNMLYRYVPYTAQTNTDCTAHHIEITPTIVTIGGLKDCWESVTPCPLLCLLDSMDPTIGRNKGLDNCTVMSRPSTAPPPIIQDGGLRYPFCFCRGEDNEATGIMSRCDLKLDATIQISNRGNATFDVDFTEGSNPVADIFWVCREGKELLQSLSGDWMGCCAPVTLTGSVFELSCGKETVARPKREVRWGGEKPTSGWTGVPVRLPPELQAMFGNSRVNYRSGSDTVWTPGGDKCCSHIPMHTAEGGRLSEALDRLKKLSAEMTANTRGGSASAGGLFSSPWKTTLFGLGMLLLGLHVLSFVWVCCFMPTVRSTVLERMSNALR